MGNVFAAAPPPPPMGLIPPPTLNPDKETSITLNEPKKLENPGTMEELHRKCKEVFPMAFEGAKITLNKGLSSHFQIYHSIVMGPMMQSGYRFGATYAGTKELSQMERFPVLAGEMDPSGNLNANMVHQFTDKIRAKLVAQFQRSRMAGFQATADYQGDTYTLSATTANPDILSNSGILVLHYLQSVTSNLALGGELAYQQGPGVPGGAITIFSGAGRYTSGDSTISANLSSSSWHICFYQKASQQLQVGVELDINQRMMDSTATIGYQVDLPKADLVFKGSIDSNWMVGAVLEKRLVPLPFTFLLSGMINHSKHQFKLGCGLNIG